MRTTQRLSSRVFLCWPRWTMLSLTWGLGTNHLTFKERRFISPGRTVLPTRNKNQIFLHEASILLVCRILYGDIIHVLDFWEQIIFSLKFGKNCLKKNIAPLPKSKLAVLLLNLILQILLYNFYLLLYTVNENDLWQEWRV